MKILSFTVTLFIALSATADFGGDWIGWGTWKFKGEGEGVYCSPMTMTWAEYSTEISIEKGYFDCEFVALDLERTAWSRKGTKLFDFEGKEVGSYDGTNFEVYMPGPNFNTTIHLQVKRTANHIDYQEVWFNSVEKVYVIQGRMFTSGRLK